VEGLAFRGLDPERAPVLPAGVAILSGIFSLLQIGCLQVSKSTLREGLLYEMVLGGN
jgi:exopolyphosphatase/guanosine-5'-triphosphate,3'-diphosphate pyrophosphatase